MRTTHFYRASLFALAISGMISSPAYALFAFHEGHDHIFVTGTAGLVYDTNIFANRYPKSDTIYSSGVGLEYSRRAGIISVDASTGIAFSRFGKFTSEDFSDPHLQSEFTVKDDRTTANLTLNVARESQADVISGVRAVSWNYAAGLDTKYRVTDRYSLSTTLDYTLQDYVHTPVLVNLASYKAGVDLFYSINSARDFFLGYNFALQETSAKRSFYNHSVNFGIDGKILPKLNGSISVGYAMEVPHGSSEHSTGSLTESVALTWNLSRRIKITGNLSQDFTATSSNGSINTLAGGLDAAFAVNAKFSLTATIGGGYNRFIGPEGGGRRDTYFSYNVGASYSLNDHVKVSTGYTYYENWSTLDFSDFIRHTFSVSLSARF